jgi:MerR family transcriptional regulator, light-induced transcriptional regulator
MSDSEPIASPADELRRGRASIAAAVVERQLAAEPDLARLYGATGREKCLEDAGHHLGSLADSVDAGDSRLFASYVEWAESVLAERGIPSEHFRRHLAVLREEIAVRLERASAPIVLEHLDAALAGLDAAPASAPAFAAAGAPHAALAREYLEALLAGERRAASSMVLEAVERGAPVKEIYRHVLQPVQCEIGLLWQHAKITVAQEHYCTAATQLVMSQLYPHVFAAEKTGRTLVATSVAGDLHEIGIRMVADFFEMDGWNTFYLGANAPTSAVVEMVVRRSADVLGISATISAHLRAVRELVASVRAHPDCRATTILVGGRLFSITPDLWRNVGADGTAPDAQAAIALAEELVRRRDPS